MNQATDNNTAVALQQSPARVSKGSNTRGTVSWKHKHHRATNACLRCRARKVRCDATPHGIPCSNCRTDEECCEVPTRRKNARQVVSPFAIPCLTSSTDCGLQGTEAVQTPTLPRGKRTNCPGTHSDTTSDTASDAQPHVYDSCPGIHRRLAWIFGLLLCVDRPGRMHRRLSLERVPLAIKAGDSTTAVSSRGHAWGHLQLLRDHRKKDWDQGRCCLTKVESDARMCFAHAEDF